MAISRKPRSRVSLDSDLHHPVSRAESATTGSVLLLLAGGAVQTRHGSFTQPYQKPGTDGSGRGTRSRAIRPLRNGMPPNALFLTDIRYPLCLSSVRQPTGQRPSQARPGRAQLTSYRAVGLRTFHSIASARQLLRISMVGSKVHSLAFPPPIRPPSVHSLGRSVSPVQPWQDIGP